jgi:lipopolysaccharide/colanic/teichoic acid biosynthesis glycosyltransferase
MVGEAVRRVPAVESRSFGQADLTGVLPAPPPHFFYDPARRALDLLLGGSLLVLTLPIVLLACLAIVLATRSSPLLFQRRIGWQGRPFTMLKLRTMRAGDELSRPLAAKPQVDDRVTAVGRVLRRTSIDELPQLVNVLLGQMTLVGPRPGLPSEVAAYRCSWRRRLGVRPGLTGLWQVSGRSSVPPERWMALDRAYVRRRGLRLDLWILLRTVTAVLSMRGAW